MEALEHHLPRTEGERLEACRVELVERIARAIPHDGEVEPLHGVRFTSASAPVELGHGVTYPAMCVAAQGRKETHVGSDCFQYDPAHYMIVTTELPYSTRITEASMEQPFLGLVLRLDPAIVGSVMVETGHVTRRESTPTRAINVSPLDAGLLDALVRLVRILDSPGDARFLQPMVTREIVYRLLKGAQQNRLRNSAVLGGSNYRIAQAIERLRKEFDQPLQVENLARDFGMSVSGFYANFKAVAAMSPLQFQKQLRLQEARRLMLAEDLDASSAGSHVGYDDSSQFTREYKRLFGEPPMRDVTRLRASAPISPKM